MAIKWKTDMGKLDRDLNKWRKKLGDGSNTAMLRVSVFAAREAAVRTEPRGKSRKRSVGAIEAGATAAVVPVNARKFNRMDRSKGTPRLNIGGRWVSVEEDRMLRNAKDINAFIEEHRGNRRGHVRRLTPDRKGVAKATEFRRVVTARKKRAGIAKGSWLGAGRHAARKQRGGQRTNIGKNFMSWAQKHANFGRARVRRTILGKSTVKLISKARHTKSSYVFPKRIGRASVVAGWRKTVAWYRRAVRHSTKR